MYQYNVETFQTETFDSMRVELSGKVRIDYAAFHFPTMSEHKRTALVRSYSDIDARTILMEHLNK